MKLTIDITGKTFQVTKEAEPKKDQKGQQRFQRDTNLPMWATQVLVQDQDGGEVITITTAGHKPEVTVGQLVTPVQFEAMPWVQEGRHGVAFRSTELKIASAARAAK
jgi:hypothetical protein